MEDKLFIYGQVKRKTGKLEPVHYVHAIEDDKAQVQVNEEMVSIKEPYSSIARWRKQINIQVNEVGS